MIQYSADGKYAVYCGYRFRRDPKTGYFLCTKKTDLGRRERLHCFVWRKANNGALIPDGYAVHHKDMNKNNNEPENLILVSDAEHVAIHVAEWDEEKRAEVARKVVELAMPKAREWHKSRAGRNWHIQHYEDVKEKLHQIEEYTCEVCGKRYTAQKNGHNRFCSNNCKAAYRRKSGVDDVARKCEECGAEFTTNKYSVRRFCECCKNKPYHR